MDGYPLSPRFPPTSPPAYHDSFETGTGTAIDADFGRGNRHHARSQSLSKRLSVALEPLKEMAETVGEKGRRFSMAAAGAGREGEGLGFESPNVGWRRERRGRRMMWVCLLVSLVVNLGYVTGRIEGGGGWMGGLGAVGKSLRGWHEEIFRADARYANMHSSEDKHWVGLLGASNGTVYSDARGGYGHYQKGKIAMSVCFPSNSS